VREITCNVAQPFRACEKIMRSGRRELTAESQEPRAESR
jgi:hypothetical protein